MKLNGASPNKLINEVEVSNDNIWQKKLLKTIEENYKRAPFFREVFPIIEKIIENDEKNLAKYLEFSIKEICKYLDIKTELILSSNLKKDNSLKGKDKVIAICKAKFLVNEKGEVQNITIVQSHKKLGFDDAVISALKK